MKNNTACKLYLLLWFTWKKADDNYKEKFSPQEKNFISFRPPGLAEDSCKGEKGVGQQAVILNLVFEVLGGNSMFFH